MGYNKLLADCFLGCLIGCISADIESKKIEKTQCSNTGLSFDDSAFPPLSSFPTTFVTSACPKQESARNDVMDANAKTGTKMEESLSQKKNVKYSVCKKTGRMLFMIPLDESKYV
ncbi:hypothetical protein HNY73_005708 [Argiope bruennichi]|uniref:Lipoprotein n=1 Tax=Argiope bruennichi TaxID=94029 RepID=A0A8T0FJV5_ARGBR|nr:hypothetical protein HNY73_005708 [Argiope bruennichi]